jgi:ribosomal-protein-alanine N-acetyltransferase
LSARAAIRRACRDDAPALASVHERCFSEAWDENVLAYFVGLPSSLTFLEERDGAVAGFILCRLICNESEVLTCAVHPAVRRQGVASRLIEAALCELRRLGGRQVFLEVAEDAVTARALYRRTGFRAVGRRRRYYTRAVGDPADALVMRRDL